MDVRSSSLQPLAVQPEEFTIAHHSLAALEHYYKCSLWFAAPLAVPRIITIAKPSIFELKHYYRYSLQLAAPLAVQPQVILVVSLG